MKTCESCRYFVRNDTPSILENEELGECHCEPPRKSSERGGSYRPQVHTADPACQHFRTPMPVAHNIEQSEAPQRRGPRKFCFAPQSACVRNFMREAGWDARDLHILTSCDQARGIAGGIFISVIGHSNPVPEPLFEVIRAHGFIVWTVSDKFIREKIERLTGAY